MSANPVRVLRQWVRSLGYELVEDEWDRAEAYCEEQVEPHVEATPIDDAVRRLEEYVYAGGSAMGAGEILRTELRLTERVAFVAGWRAREKHGALTGGAVEATVGGQTARCGSAGVVIVK